MNHSEESLSLQGKLQTHFSSKNLLEKKPRTFIKIKPQICNSSRSKSVTNTKHHTIKPPLYKTRTPLRSKSLKRLQTETDTIRRTSPPRPESRLKHRRIIKSDSKNERFLKTSTNDFAQVLQKETKETLAKTPDLYKKPAKNKLIHQSKKVKSSKPKVLSKPKFLKKPNRAEERSSSRENKDLKKANKKSSKINLKLNDFENFSLKKKAKSKGLIEKKTSGKKGITKKNKEMTCTGFSDAFLTHDGFKITDRTEKIGKKNAKKTKVLNEKLNTQRPRYNISKLRSKLLHCLKKNNSKVIKKNEETLKQKQSRNDLLEKSAKVIQRWFRKILTKRKTENRTDSESLNSSSEDFEYKKIPQGSVKSSLLNLLFLKTNNQEENQCLGKEKSNISLGIPNSSSFQKKRPKELKIEEINYPIKDPDSSNCDSMSLKSPKFNSEEHEYSSKNPNCSSSGLSNIRSPKFNLEEIKYSFQTDSLENTLKSLNKSKKQDNKIEDYIKNIASLSENDSLDSDMDFSSTVIHQLERLANTQVHVSLSPNMPCKIPIQSPNNSIDISEKINEIINSEINLFLSTVKINLTPTVDPSADFMKTFLVSVFKEFQEIEDEIIDIVNVPVYIDPLEKLQILQCSNIGELTKYHEIEEIIPQNICEVLQKKFSDNQEAKKMYVKMLYECVNEAMNLIRPFGFKGVPDPWVSHPRFLFGEGELKRVFNRTSEYMLKWVNMRGGIYRENLEQCDFQEFNLKREEKINCMICDDVKFEEEEWVNYEDEETQSKGDISDMILFDLFNEIIGILENFNI